MTPSKSINSLLSYNIKSSKLLILRDDNNKDTIQPIGYINNINLVSNTKTGVLNIKLAEEIPYELSQWPSG